MGGFSIVVTTSYNFQIIILKGVNQSVLAVYSP